MSLLDWRARNVDEYKVKRGFECATFMDLSK